MTSSRGWPRRVTGTPVAASGTQPAAVSETSSPPWRRGVCERERCGLGWSSWLLTPGPSETLDTDSVHCGGGPPSIKPVIREFVHFLLSDIYRLIQYGVLKELLGTGLKAHIQVS